MSLWYTDFSNFFTEVQIPMRDAQSTSHTPMTEARRRANKKYNARFVELKVRLTREERATVKAHAEQMGESVSTFIHRAIDEAMARDQK